jgi:hypothetical protein
MSILNELREDVAEIRETCKAPDRADIALILVGAAWAFTFIAWIFTWG